ncbi:TetR/AcrR family transcriptional regulator [Pseudonocardia endophytica]|uniref:TetR family transcriptional regulator n=1 Tax=Pseudonocardia endophytica TaxID=401976 RepID=A0A4R1HND1_PSEEN|nr:TetR/AcrR family transcriptional regulator [Pseudonocardia endophytica]TCK22105.1 TetR family transcriptional regulator [Pseudonocardia endophytica]
MTMPQGGSGRAVGRRTGARDKIVAASVELFDKHGYEATSVQQVVEGAGVTKGSFYHHFGSKEDVLLVVHDTFIDHQLDVLDSITTGDRPVRDALAELIEEIVVGVETYQAHQRIFYEQHRFLTDERFEAVKSKRDEFERRVVRLIERGVDRGEFRAVSSPKILAFGLVGMSAWTYHWYHEGSMTAREIGRFYARVVLDGISNDQP